MQSEKLIRLSCPYENNKTTNKLKSREIKEGWIKKDEGLMKNDEGWKMNDEGGWFQAVWGVSQTNRQTFLICDWK